MSKTFIHIGLQKTASSYFQKLVFPNIQDVFYLGRPYTQENEAFNSLQYADDIEYDSSLLQSELELAKKAANKNAILISDELFSGFAFWGFSNRGTIARRLAEIAPESEIILFLRNQADLINSLYNQYVKIGWYDKPLGPGFIHGPGPGTELQKWIEGDRKPDNSRRRFIPQSAFSVETFRYSQLLKSYNSTFSKVHVFLYEDFKNDPSTQIKRLESILQARVDLPNQELNKVNKSLDEKGLRHRITKNKLTNLFGPSYGIFRRQLIKLTSWLQPVQSRSQRFEYINKLLDESGIFEDNKELAKQLPEHASTLSKYYGAP